MLKKMLTIMIVGLILVMAYIYFSNGHEEIEYWLKGSHSITLSEEKSISLENLKGKIILEDGIFYRIHENILEAYLYDGNLQARKEHDAFIESIYGGRNPYVKMVNQQLYPAFSSEEITFALTDKIVLDITENDNTFVASSNQDGSLNYLDIYDSNYISSASLSFENEKIIDYQRSSHSNGMIITTFNYIGSSITTYIREYLTEGHYQVWMTELPGELAIFVNLQKDGLYVVTHLNLYKLNNEGKILWHYGGFDQIKDFQIVDNQVFLLSGGHQTALHILSTDGKLIKKVETTNIYLEILPFDQSVILSGRQELAYLNGDKIDAIFFAPELIQQTHLEGDNLRILFPNKLSTYKIKIK